MKLFDKPFNQYLSTPFHKYDNVCWERDGAQIEARRRVDVPDIDSSSLRDLASQAPSANVTVFMKVST